MYIIIIHLFICIYSYIIYIIFNILFFKDLESLHTPLTVALAPSLFLTIVQMLVAKAFPKGRPMGSVTLLISRENMAQG